MHTEGSEPSDFLDGRHHQGSGREPRRSFAERFDDALLRLDELREQPLVAASAAVCVVLLALGGWWLGRSPSQRPVEELIPHIRLETTEVTLPPSPPVVVHIAGAVEAPGVYTLTPGSRVEDALDAAGGAQPDADLVQLNLAAIVPDGVQIMVPRVGEVLTSAPALFSGEESGSGPLDLNRASATELESLPGVGPATATAIVAWREDHGPFATVDSLLEVPGIGPSKLAGLADLVVVR